LTIFSQRIQFVGWDILYGFDGYSTLPVAECSAQPVLVTDRVLGMSSLAASVNSLAAARSEALAAGVDGFAYKGDPPSELLFTIRELRREKVQDINSNASDG
jgi:hypothetical protein